MGFFKNLDQDKQDSDIPAETIEQDLRKEIDTILYIYQSALDFNAIQKWCADVLSDELLAFAMQSIQTNLPIARKKKMQMDDARYFQPHSKKSGYYVSVSVFPWSKASEIQPHLNGGYSTQLITLGAEIALIDSQATTDLALKAPWTHLVHWVYGSDGINKRAWFSFISQAADPNPQKHTFLIATDLLTLAEMDKMGL